MAFTSPCAVGSLVEVTELAPSPTISPLRAMTAPNGPPLPETTFSVARAMARRRKSGLGWPVMREDLCSWDSRRQIQYGIRSTRGYFVENRRESQSGEQGGGGKARRLSGRKVLFEHLEKAREPSRMGGPRG